MKLAMATRRALAGVLLGIVATSSWAQKHLETAIESAHTTVRFSLFGECSDIHFLYVGESEDKHVEIYFTNARNERLMFIGTILPEGGLPVVESVLFRNADADLDREMFVLTKWRISHPGLDTSGNLYRTYVFDQEIAPESGGLKRLTDIEKRLGEGFDGIRNGHEVEFSVKTAKDVARVLELTDD